MTWVKICGITNLEDAMTAVDSGADALGFVFYEKSKRRVEEKAVREIVCQLPSSIEKVGVFVDESFMQMEEIAQELGLTGIQAHAGSANSGADDAVAFRSRTHKYIALRASDLTDSAGWARLSGWERVLRAIFLDSGTESEPGGTGKAFDWEKAEPTVRALRERFQVVVAGGLSPANVTEAIRILKPWGVDVSSGVEASPGKKDHEKVRAFIAAVRSEEQRK